MSDHRAFRETLDEYANDLLTHGVVVVPLMDETQRANLERRVWAAIDEFPEYKVTGRDVQRVLGGCGLLGNPSSFHHPCIRSMRRFLNRLFVRELMRAYVARLYGPEFVGAVRLESLFDRLCVRCSAFGKPMADEWHRDVYKHEKDDLRPLPSTLPGGDKDVIFGGWWNLDGRDQHFVGLVGSHRESYPTQGGFDVFSREEIAALGFSERRWEQRSKTIGHSLRTNELGDIVVPPGHMILFPQNLIHAVKSGKQPPTPALRLYHGFRLTCEDRPLFEYEAQKDGGVPRVPSGQLAVMYARNHYAAFANAKTTRWRKWGETVFKDVCLYERKVGCFVYKTPGSISNQDVFVNKNRIMPSLTQMGLMSTIFVYTEQDERILRPSPL